MAPAASSPDVDAVLNYYGTDTTRHLCSEIAELSGGVVFLGFSRGKDALAAWLFMRQFFKRIIPFHCASVPHLKFVDYSLEYYERAFGTPIIRCLSGDTSASIGHMVYQPWNDWDAIDNLDLWEYNNSEVVDLLREQYKLPNAWCAFGMSMHDSIFRRTRMKRLQGRNPGPRSVYPCYDWPKGMNIEIIEKASLKLAPDYLITGRSLAGTPHLRCIERMPDIFPDDFRTIERYFPLIRASLARNEFRRMKEAAAKLKTKGK